MVICTPLFSLTRLVTITLIINAFEVKCKQTLGLSVKISTTEGSYHCVEVRVDIKLLSYLYNWDFLTCKTLSLDKNDTMKPIYKHSQPYIIAMIFNYLPSFSAGCDYSSIPQIQWWLCETDIESRSWICNYGIYSLIRRPSNGHLFRRHF